MKSSFRVKLLFSISVMLTFFLTSVIFAEVLSIKIKIPDLPEQWRLPSVAELDHIMRPQKYMLFPDYVDSGKIDNDRLLDIVVLVVSKKDLQEAALVYLSSKKKWEILDAHPTFESKKVGMTVKVIESKPTAISYGKLGGNGYLYYWDQKKEGFTKILE